MNHREYMELWGRLRAMGRGLYTVFVPGVWLLAYIFFAWLGGLWRPITISPGFLVAVCSIWMFAAQLAWFYNERLYAEFLKSSAGRSPVDSNHAG